MTDQQPKGLDSAPADAFHNWLRTRMTNSDDASMKFLWHYADVVAALRDEHLVQDNGHAGFAQPERTGTAKENAPAGFQQLQQLKEKSDSIISRWFGSRNPPDHTRIRGLLTSAFGIPRAEALRPRIQALTDELLDRVEPTGQMELIADLAYPLPLMVICELMGISLRNREQFRRWSNDIAKMLDLSPTPLATQRGRFALLAVTEYLDKEIAERRKNLGGDLISSLLEAEAQGRLSADEVLANSVALLFSGQEATAYFIGNAILSLLTHQNQLGLLREQPELIARAVEELLRFDTTGQLTWRKAREQVSLGNMVIQPGQSVGLALAAANRDGTEFTNPDELDLTRSPNHHLTFGFGIHYCLGAPLARVEAQIAINTLLRRMPRLALRDNVLEWEANTRLRGLQALPLTF